MPDRRAHEAQVLGMPRKLWERLSVASNDLHLASGFVLHLLKKGWHYAQYERRESTYLQQSAFTTAAIVSYGRAFSQSKGWPTLPREMSVFNASDQAFHDQLIALRNQVYAHSDSNRHSRTPIDIDGLPSSIVGSPFLRLTAEECTQMLGLIGQVQEYLAREILSLRGKLRSGT